MKKDFLVKLTDSIKDEYLLPFIADAMLKEGVAFIVCPPMTIGLVLHTRKTSQLWLQVLENSLQMGFIAKTCMGI